MQRLPMVGDEWEPGSTENGLCAIYGETAVRECQAGIPDGGRYPYLEGLRVDGETACFEE